MKTIKWDMITIMYWLFWRRVGTPTGDLGHELGWHGTGRSA